MTRLNKELSDAQLEDAMMRTANRFTEAEMNELVLRVAARMNQGSPTLIPAEFRDALKKWTNGYQQHYLMQVPVGPMFFVADWVIQINGELQLRIHGPNGETVWFGTFRTPE